LAIKGVMPIIKWILLRKTSVRISSDLLVVRLETAVIETSGTFKQDSCQQKPLGLNLYKVISYNKMENLDTDSAPDSQVFSPKVSIFAYTGDSFCSVHEEVAAEY
jgi:hypothetical protein